MFDPKVFYSFYTAQETDEYGGDSTHLLIDTLKNNTWRLVKEYIPQEYLIHIEEKIEISDETITYFCNYNPLIKR